MKNLKTLKIYYIMMKIRKITKLTLPVKKLRGNKKHTLVFYHKL